MIRPVHIHDAQELLEMYNYYVINTTVNFDIEPLSLKTFLDKLNIILVSLLKQLKKRPYEEIYLLF